MQLFGTKEYVFYSPDQGPWLYPREGVEANKSSVADLEHPDLVRFRCLHAPSPRGACCTPGNAVCAGWLVAHARILEPSITVSANTMGST